MLSAITASSGPSSPRTPGGIQSAKPRQSLVRCAAPSANELVPRARNNSGAASALPHQHYDRSNQQDCGQKKSPGLIDGRQTFGDASPVRLLTQTDLLAAVYRGAARRPRDVDE